MTVTLMYHDVTADADPALGASVTNYFVTPAAFAEQTAAASDGDVRITFDDGWAGSFTNTAEVLAEHDRVGLVFVTTGLIGQAGFADSSLIQTAAVSGPFRVGSHGVTHRMLATLDDDSVRLELVESKDRLEQITGRLVDTFAAPGGSIDRRVERIAREVGYAEIFGSRPGANSPSERVARRLAVTKGTTAGQVTAWSQGQFGQAPLRYAVLDAAKRLFGRSRYQRLRARLLGSEDDLDMTDLLSEDVRVRYSV